MHMGGVRKNATFLLSDSEYVTINQLFKSLTGIPDAVTFIVFEAYRNLVPVDHTKPCSAQQKESKRDISQEHRSLPAQRSC